MSRLFVSALLSLLVALSLVLPTSGLYFNVVEGSRKCFIEEVPEDVLVLGRYTSPDFGKLSLNQQGYADADNKAAIIATVTDPRNEVLLTHATGAEGKFGFTSVVGGEHVICLATNTSSWYGQTREFVRKTKRRTEGEGRREQAQARTLSVGRTCGRHVRARRLANGC